jgi:hypothetical protein
MTPICTPLNSEFGLFAAAALSGVSLVVLQPVTNPVASANFPMSRLV